MLDCIIIDYSICPRLRSYFLVTSRLYTHAYRMWLKCMKYSKGTYLRLQDVDPKRNIWCTLSRSNTGLTLLQCTRPTCHMSMLWRSSNWRVSNCVHFFRNIFLVGWVKSTRMVGWCRKRAGGLPGERSTYYWYGGSILLWIHIGPTWTQCGDDNVIMYCTGKVLCHKVIFRCT